MALLEKRGYTVKRVNPQGEVRRNSLATTAGWRARPIPVPKARRKDINTIDEARTVDAPVRQPPADAALLSRIQQAGIPAVEIFCARQHLDYRDKAQIAELGHWFRDSELKLHSLHSPMYNDEIWGRSGPHAVITITETVKGDAAAAWWMRSSGRWRSRRHSVPVPDPAHGRERRRVRYAQVRRGVFARWKSSVSSRAQRGVEILLENIPNGLSSAEKLLQFEELTHVGMNYVFDTGHAHMGDGRRDANSIC